MPLKLDMRVTRRKQRKSLTVDTKLCAPKKRKRYQHNKYSFIYFLSRLQNQFHGKYSFAYLPLFLGKSGLKALGI